MRVIIIDDSAAVRARLVAMLAEAPGVDVVAATRDGFEGVTLARLHAPDAVILDLNLPGISGLEVLDLLKARPNPPVVIVLTNHPHACYRAACMRGGADFFFDKSCDFERLVVAVGALATSRS